MNYPPKRKKLTWTEFADRYTAPREADRPTSHVAVCLNITVMSDVVVGSPPPTRQELWEQLLLQAAETLQMYAVHHNESDNAINEEEDDGGDINGITIEWDEE